MVDGFNLLKTDYALIGYISALGAYRNHMAADASDAFNDGFYRTAYRVADVLENIAAPDAEVFQTALQQVQADLDALHAEIGDYRQNSVLWQQLSLIVRQLEPSYQALHGSGEMTAQTAAA